MPLTTFMLRHSHSCNRCDLFDECVNSLGVHLPHLRTLDLEENSIDDAHSLLPLPKGKKCTRKHSPTASTRMPCMCDGQDEKTAAFLLELMLSGLPNPRQSEMPARRHAHEFTAHCDVYVQM